MDEHRPGAGRRRSGNRRNCRCGASRRCAALESADGSPAAVVPPRATRPRPLAASGRVDRPARGDARGPSRGRRCAAGPRARQGARVQRRSQRTHRDARADLRGARLRRRPADRQALRAVACTTAVRRRTGSGEAAAKETARRGAAIIDCAVATAQGHRQECGRQRSGHGPARTRRYGRGAEAARTRQGPSRRPARGGAATPAARPLTAFAVTRNERRRPRSCGRRRGPALRPDRLRTCRSARGRSAN